MDSVAKALRFTLTNFKAFSDSNHNVIIYNSSFTHETKESAPPSVLAVNLVKTVNKAHDSLISVLELFTDSTTSNNYLITASYDKQIKLWDLSTETPSLLDSLKHPKKIDHAFIDLKEEKLIFSDRTGDIFETYFKDLKLTKPEVIQANMDTLALLTRLEFPDGKTYCALADEAEKLKIFKYPEIFHLMRVYSPYKQTYFSKILNLTPNALVTLLSTGDVALINTDSFVGTEYKAKQLDIKSKIENKQITNIFKVDSECFIAVDDFFTVLVVCTLKGDEIVNEKVVDISDLRIIRDEKDHSASQRFIEAQRLENRVSILIKFESKQELTHEESKLLHSQIKLSENVYFIEFTVNL